MGTGPLMPPYWNALRFFHARKVLRGSLSQIQSTLSSTRLLFSKTIRAAAMRLPGEHPITTIREWAKILIPGAALAVATYAAYFAYQQFGLARRSAENQQRAYVMIDSVSAFDVATSQSSIVYKNFGQTPALDVSVLQSIAVQPYPRPRTDIEYVGSTQFRGNVAPSSSKSLVNRLGHALSPEDLESLKQAKTAIYLDINIKYKDIFGAMRNSVFHYYINGQLDDSNNGFYDTGEGDTFN
jgi:hypothetical protein